jgi:rubrerythrin
MKKALFALTVLIISCNQSGKDTSSKDSATVSTMGDTPTATVVDTAATAGEGLAYVCPPCGCNLHDSTFTHTGNCPACNMPLVAKK